MVKLTKDHEKLVEILAKRAGVSSSKVVEGVLELYFDGMLRRTPELNTFVQAVTQAVQELNRTAGIEDQHGNRYKSVIEICEKLGLKERLVHLVLSGRRKSTGGFTFRQVP